MNTAVSTNGGRSAAVAGVAAMSQKSVSTIVLPGVDIDVDIDSFRAAMHELAAGVAIVTVGKDRDITGFTATSILSLSAYPPRLLVCVDQGSASWLALHRHPHFGVNILRDQESTLANRFAGRDGLTGAARYAGARWATMLTGTPILENALAALDCEVEEMIPRYDRSIVIGRVLAASICPGPFPLVYWQGNYHPLDRAARSAGMR